MDKLTNVLRTVGFKWPYRVTPEDAFKKFLAVGAGIIIGAKCVNSYFKPMEEFYKEMDEGKKALFLKYKQRFNDIKAGRLVE